MNGAGSSNRIWSELGMISVSNLIDTRLQLHWAAQIVAAFGNSVIERQADDSQSNLGWVRKFRALCSHPSPDGFSVGLRLADLTLLFFDKHQNVTSEFRLARCTLQQGFEWLTSTYAQQSRGKTDQPFALREYEMPGHPVEQNVPFSLKAPAPFLEYQHWYANAHLSLTSLSENWQQASPVRCWPHHFDIATLVTLDPNKSVEETRSVGCGMSPGDDTYAEPYWYVNLWPYPETSQLPQLSIGKWHTEGWVGAILTATALVEGGPRDSQAERVNKYLEDATQACFRLLGGRPSPDKTA